MTNDNSSTNEEQIDNTLDQSDNTILDISDAATNNLNKLKT